MENEFKTLSQEDIDALVSGKVSAQEEPPDRDTALPTEPDGPLPKVINVTGMDVSRAVPNAAVTPTPPVSVPEPTPAAFSAPAPNNIVSTDPKIEQSVNETKAEVQQIRQELQALVQQYQSLTQNLEKISKGLKDTPSYRVRETFTCGNCKSHNNVAMPVKCTQCDTVNWWGWWPEKKE